MSLNSEDVWKVFCCKLNHYIKKWINDAELAHDIEQEVFIKIHEKIYTLKDNSKLVPWVLQITKNTVFDYLRKKNTTVKLSNRTNSDEINISKISIEQSERDLNEELTSGIKSLVENLPFKYKQALQMVEFEGVSQIDLAKKLKISVSGAKSRVQRGRQMIKEQLLQCCNYQFDKYGNVVGVKNGNCQIE